MRNVSDPICSITAVCNSCVTAIITDLAPYSQQKISMSKVITYPFLFIYCLLNLSFAFADETVNYRFERLWPQLEQPWYFSEPSDIAIAQDGSVYIADTFNHRIQQFSADGVFIRIWGHNGSGNGQFTFPRNLAVAPNGNVYVADGRLQQFSSEGEFIQVWTPNYLVAEQFNSVGDIAIAFDGSLHIEVENSSIQQFTAEGDFIREWGKRGFSDGRLYSPEGLAIAADGNIYVADTENQRIQRFSSEGEFIQKWGSKGSKDGEFYNPESLAIASSNDVYVADLWNNRVQQFSSQGDFVRRWGRQGAGNRQFSKPKGIAVAKDGRVYVADSGNDRIQQFSAEGRFIRSWGSLSSRKGEFNHPIGVALASDNSVYVADTENQRIQQFGANGEFIRTWGSKGTEDGQFSQPGSLAIAPNGSIYVVDLLNHNIQQFDANGEFILSWGGKGSENGQFNSPGGIAIAPDGSVYVADSLNYRIQQFSADGVFIRSWGSESAVLNEISFKPKGIAITPDGNVFVVVSNSIYQFSAWGNFIRKWGDKGIEDGQLSNPESIAISAEGDIFVTDSLNHRIQQFSAKGEFVQKWGSKGSANGQFSRPRGIAIALDGSVYIADTSNNRIQKFVPRKKDVADKYPYKAIILAGGGERIAGRTNHIWGGTWRITQKAYAALSQQAFIVHDEIKFLTAGNTQFDLDNNDQLDDLEAASKKSLRLAITEWAADAKNVVIFLANHGGPGKFQISSTETLSGEELNSWVSQLENNISGTVTVIIEACNSASFFNQLSKSKRYLFSSAKANQPAVISNDGFSSFSYFFWSEISVGASLKEAFRAAQQSTSSIIIDGVAQGAQAETDGDHRFTQLDLDILGNYCLGNCNQTAGAAPVIKSVKPKTRILESKTAQEFSVEVDHLQALSSVWALVQRPDDISIDPNQALNFEKINLSCDKQGFCQGRYDNFDIIGEYRISFYAMDVQGEVSLPETVVINQAQGKSVVPTFYDDQRAVIYLRDVDVKGKHLQVALELQGEKFVVIALSDAVKSYTPSAQFNAQSGILSIPHALAFGNDYQATLKYLGNLEFALQSALPLEPIY